MAGARAKLHHDMQHYINEVTGEQLQEILGHITALARRATQAGAGRHRGARRPSGRLAVFAADQPAHRRVRRQLREPHALRPRGRARHPRRFAGHLHRLQAADHHRGPAARAVGGLFIDEAGGTRQTARGRRRRHLPCRSGPTTPAILNDTIPAMGTRPECFMAPYACRIKEAVSVPVSTVGRIMTPEDGARLIEEGVCDFIGLGRPDAVRPRFTQTRWPPAKPT